VPEHARHTEELRAGTQLRVGSVTLIPIERVVVHAGTVVSAAWFTAAKEPFALVVRDEGGVRVIGVGAEEVSLASMGETIPGLVSMVEASMGRGP
jgi:hypothetical protein